jgi:DNA repair exonuclease SbcCD ATPase subunit
VALAALEDEQTRLKAAQLESNRIHGQLVSRIGALSTRKSLVDGQLSRIVQLEQQLLRYQDLDFSDDEFALVSEQLEKANSLMVRVETATREITRLASSLQLLDEKIRNLSIYDGSTAIEEELTVLNAAVSENKRRNQQLEDLRLEEGKLRHELELLDLRITNSLVNAGYNGKRQKYMDDLKKAYDVLHASAFPRKLIQNYAEVVEGNLAKYLEKFSLPYHAKILEGFKIQMVNEEGQYLPKVSGGQEVIIGMCLRLALHKLFAQSFPLWIVDEGSTHLSETKKKSYFQLIDTIRSQKLINQIIIIDHDSRLNQVVDKVIEL